MEKITLEKLNSLLKKRISISNSQKASKPMLKSTIGIKNLENLKRKYLNEKIPKEDSSNEKQKVKETKDHKTMKENMIFKIKEVLSTYLIKDTLNIHEIKTLKNQLEIFIENSHNLINDILLQLSNQQQQECVFKKQMVKLIMSLESKLNLIQNENIKFISKNNNTNTHNFSDSKLQDDYELLQLKEIINHKESIIKNLKKKIWIKGKSHKIVLFQNYLKIDFFNHVFNSFDFNHLDHFLLSSNRITSHNPNLKNIDKSKLYGNFNLFYGGINKSTNNNQFQKTDQLSVNKHNNQFDISDQLLINKNDNRFEKTDQLSVNKHDNQFEISDQLLVNENDNRFEKTDQLSVNKNDDQLKKDDGMYQERCYVNALIKLNSKNSKLKEISIKEERIEEELKKLMEKSSKIKKMKKTLESLKNDEQLKRIINNKKTNSQLNTEKERQMQLISDEMKTSQNQYDLKFKEFESLIEDVRTEYRLIAKIHSKNLKCISTKIYSSNNHISRNNFFKRSFKDSTFKDSFFKDVIFKYQQFNHFFHSFCHFNNTLGHVRNIKLQNYLLKNNHKFLKIHFHQNFKNQTNPHSNYHFQKNSNNRSNIHSNNKLDPNLNTLLDPPLNNQSISYSNTHLNQLLNNHLKPNLNNQLNQPFNNSFKPDLNNQSNQPFDNSLKPDLNNHLKPNSNNQLNQPFNNSLKPDLKNQRDPSINNISDQQFNNDKIRNESTQDFASIKLSKRIKKWSLLFDKTPNKTSLSIRFNLLKYTNEYSIIEKMKRQILKVKKISEYLNSTNSSQFFNFLEYYVEEKMKYENSNNNLKKDKNLNNLNSLFLKSYEEFKSDFFEIMTELLSFVYSLNDMNDKNENKEISKNIKGYISVFIPLLCDKIVELQSVNLDIQNFQNKKEGILVNKIELLKNELKMKNNEISKINVEFERVKKKVQLKNQTLLENERKMIELENYNYSMKSQLNYINPEESKIHKNEIDRLKKTINQMRSQSYDLRLNKNTNKLLYLHDNKPCNHNIYKPIHFQKQGLLISDFQEDVNNYKTHNSMNVNNTNFEKQGLLISDFQEDVNNYKTQNHMNVNNTNYEIGHREYLINSNLKKKNDLPVLESNKHVNIDFNPIITKSFSSASMKINSYLNHICDRGSNYDNKQNELLKPIRIKSKVKKPNETKEIEQTSKTNIKLKITHFSEDLKGNSHLKNEYFWKGTNTISSNKDNEVKVIKTCQLKIIKLNSLFLRIDNFLENKMTFFYSKIDILKKKIGFIRALLENNKTFISIMFSHIPKSLVYLMNTSFYRMKIDDETFFSNLNQKDLLVTNTLLRKELQLLNSELTIFKTKSLFEKCQLSQINNSLLDKHNPHFDIHLSKHLNSHVISSTDQFIENNNKLISNHSNVKDDRNIKINYQNIKDDCKVGINHQNIKDERNTKINNRNIKSDVGVKMNDKDRIKKSSFNFQEEINMDSSDNLIEMNSVQSTPKFRKGFNPFDHKTVSLNNELNCNNPSENKNDGNIFENSKELSLLNNELNQLETDIIGNQIEKVPMSSISHRRLITKKDVENVPSDISFEVTNYVPENGLINNDSPVENKEPFDQSFPNSSSIGKPFTFGTGKNSFDSNFSDLSKKNSFQKKLDDPNESESNINLYGSYVHDHKNNHKKDFIYHHRELNQDSIVGDSCDDINCNSHKINHNLNQSNSRLGDLS